MNYITTNIRISESDYLRLKKEALNKRKSLGAVIREKIGASELINPKEQVEMLLKELDEVANKNSKKLKNWDSGKALREIRDSS